MEVDSTLLAAVRRMNKDALAEIFDRYAPALFRYTLRLGGDAIMADHIVGDVFAKLLENLAAGRAPSTNLRSYLYQATYHMIIDEARFSQREAPLEVADYAQGNGHTPSTGFENRLLLETLISAIRKDLTEDQRHVIVLRFLEGFSLRETADIIGKQVYNVKVIQNRGIAKLRKILGYKVS